MYNIIFSHVYKYIHALSPDNVLLICHRHVAPLLLVLTTGLLFGWFSISRPEGKLEIPAIGKLSYVETGVETYENDKLKGEGNSKRYDITVSMHAG